MRIGELAKRTGASVRLLRYYEEQGLITSTRSPSGQRHFTEHQVERVGFVRTLLAAGVPTRTIAEMMPCMDAPSVETVDGAMESLARERDRITAHIAELTRACAAIDGHMDTARERRARLTAPRAS
ncbi:MULTISPECIES: MerR family transcriptional regulator [unclassified Nocardiopsis]|uniref:MerR family transcriptional regulator n=1 Tax=Nocardiopsis TaxID=2013 RepID=UPI00387B741E